MKFRWKISIAIVLVAVLFFPSWQIMRVRADSPSLTVSGSMTVQGGIDVQVTDQTGLEVITNHWTTDAIKTTTGHSWFGGNIRVGSTAVNPDYGRNITSLMVKTDPSYYQLAVSGTVKTAYTTAPSPYMTAGGYFENYLLANNTQNWTTALGMVGVESKLFALEGATGNIKGVANYLSFSKLDSVNVDNWYGFYLDEDQGTANINRQYGLYVARLARGAQSRYALYTEGTTPSYLGGHLGVGTLPEASKGINYKETVSNPGFHPVGVMSDLTTTRTDNKNPGYVPYSGFFSTTIGAANTKNWNNGIVGVFSTTNTAPGASGVISLMMNYAGEASIASSSVTNRYGLYLGNATGAGALTNQYGIYIENMTKGTSGNFAIVTEGGFIRFCNLPLSDPGISGVLWSDNGTLKVSQ